MGTRIVTGVVPVGNPVAMIMLGFGSLSKSEVSGSVATIESLSAAADA